MDDFNTLLQQSLANKGLQPKVHAVHTLFEVNKWLSKQNQIIATTCVATMCKPPELHIQIEHAIGSQEMQALIPDLKTYLQNELHIEIDTVILKRK